MVSSAFPSIISQTSMSLSRLLSVKIFNDSFNKLVGTLLLDSSIKLSVNLISFCNWSFCGDSNAELSGAIILID